VRNRWSYEVHHDPKLIGVRSEADHLDHPVLWGNQVFAGLDRYAVKIDNDSGRILQGERFYLPLLRNHDLEKEEGALGGALTIDDDVDLLLGGEGRRPCLLLTSLGASHLDRRVS
jgi:hypothetical protein